jgi:hypothetical protein
LKWKGGNWKKQKESLLLGALCRANLPIKWIKAKREKPEEKIDETKRKVEGEKPKKAETKVEANKENFT